MTKTIKNDNKAIAKYLWLMQNDSICGVISSFYTDRGTVFATVNDTIFLKLDNRNGDLFTHDIVSVGDSIIKHSFSPFYFIKHEGKFYKFHFRKSIIDGVVVEPCYTSTRDSIRVERERNNENRY